jgi:hypothetical protein
MVYVNNDAVATFDRSSKVRPDVTPIVRFKCGGCKVKKRRYCER